MTDIPEAIKRRHVVNAEDAREQASEGYGFLRSEFRRVTVDGKEHIFEIPHRDLFDAEQQERWDELQHEVQTKYDREPDLLDSEGRVLRRGAVIFPHHVNGELVKPTWGERLGIVLWGKPGAAVFKKGRGNFNEIELIWAKQAEGMRRWREADPKSDRGGVDVAAASNGNRS